MKKQAFFFVKNKNQKKCFFEFLIKWSDYPSIYNITSQKFKILFKKSLSFHF